MDLDLLLLLLHPPLPLVARLVLAACPFSMDFLPLLLLDLFVIVDRKSDYIMDCCLFVCLDTFKFRTLITLIFTRRGTSKSRLFLSLFDNAVCCQRFAVLNLFTSFTGHALQLDHDVFLIGHM